MTIKNRVKKTIKTAANKKRRNRTQPTKPADHLKDAFKTPA